MAFIRAYLVTLTYSVMVAAWAISPMTVLRWQVALPVMLGWTVVALLEWRSNKRSRQAWNAIGYGFGKADD